MQSDSAITAKSAPLGEFTLLKVSGEDALTFLQSQLTQDLNLVSNTQALLAAWCNPKGRCLASFLVWQDQDNQAYYMLMKRDLLEATLPRLRMFVLRSKVVIEPVEATISGFWGATLDDDIFPQELAAGGDFSVVYTSNKIWIKFPAAAEEARYLAIDMSNAASESTEVQEAAYWNAQDIQQGIAWIELANREEFIPQSINFDAIDAVNYKKGCFPGQEVVARSHYRGTLKRRSYIGHVASADESIAVGADIFQGDRPVGQVVNIAHLPEGGTWVLFETRLEAVDGTDEGPLHLGGQEGPALTVIAPPYPLEKPEN